MRIGGCDVGCHWCDVKESWDPNKHPLTEISDILSQIKDSDKTIVITGGEPLMWDMTPLTTSLKGMGKRIHLETSGSYNFSGTWDWVCLSPKKTKPPIDQWYSQADELKIIIYNQDDLKWAEYHSKRVGKKCKIYLQPEWSKKEKVMPMIIKFLESKPDWRLSLQSHKYIGLP